MDERSEKKNDIPLLNLDEIKLQSPPPPNYKHRLPNGLSYSYYPTKPTLLGSSSFFHSFKDIPNSSLGKEPTNITLLNTPQRENAEKNKCELLKQQIQECMQNDFTCNKLFESYLTQCTL